MTKYLFFFISIGLFWFSSCEKSTIQNTDEESIVSELSSRTVESCDDCPNEDDCCCAVSIPDLSPDVTVSLCGTSDGATSSCSGGGGGTGLPPFCPVYSSGQQDITLSHPGDYRKLFCNRGAFSIKNLNTSTNVRVNLTCQHDQLAPQILNLNIPAGATYYYVANSSCYLTTCTN